MPVGRLLAGTYVSHDGGRTWHLDEVAEQGAGAARIAASVRDSHVMRVFADAANLMTFRSPARPVSAALPPGLWQRGSILSADFADDAHGWVLYSAGQCADFKSDCTQQREVLATADGGQSFRLITPPAPVQHQRRDSTAPLATLSGAITDGRRGDPSGTQISQGEGFDQCQASTVSNMQTWWSDSPYSTTGIYIGGENETCSQPNLNASWVSQVTGQQGWGLVPIWVGPQATCTTCTSCSLMSSDPTTAASQGLAEADSAVASASSLGIDKSIIYYDLEKYATGNPSCSTAAQAFIDAWAQELHVDGFLAGAYGDPSNAAADWTAKTISNPPDALWFSAWDNVNSVWDPSRISNSVWVDNQRIHQFCSDGSSVPCTLYGDSFGGVSFSIDGDVLDGPVVPGQYLPAPSLASPGNGAVNTGTTPTFTWSRSPARAAATGLWSQLLSRRYLLGPISHPHARPALSTIPHLEALFLARHMHRHQGSSSLE